MASHKVKFEDIVLFENDNYVVVNKPAFIATLEDRNEPVNLLQLARQIYPDAQVCHRLDKETSGALAIARNPEAYRHLSMQFEKREVTKLYHAVADGLHQFSEFLVDAPILKQDDGVVRISTRDGKPAQTWFNALKSFRMHTLMECRPVTGRMHQIRIHLAVSGAPIMGDTQYGGKLFYLSQVKRSFNLKKYTEEEPFMKRMALHAFSLAFADVDGSPVKVDAPYHKDMQALVKQLEANR
ncbi:MAG TPA: RNA pseudouridine synthase [Chryseolinea sp.]|nr:RNA pseudouridine synthase [Chryseolinea sp.]